MVESLLEDPLLREIPEIDGYKVLEPCVLYANIGQGGLGAVYRGRHLTLDIDVAVKCLKVATRDEGDIIERFQREAKVAATIVHQNLIHVYHVDHRHGMHYLVMEFLNGENVRERIERKGAIDVDEALSIMLAAAQGCRRPTRSRSSTATSSPTTSWSRPAAR